MNALPKPMPPVSALATILAPPYGNLVHQLWDAFKEDCGTEFILAANPIPHFSWQGAEYYDEAGLNEGLRAFLAKASPFQVRTSGIGIFTGEILVVYITIVKDKLLQEFHSDLWASTYRFAHGMNNHYSPENWIPHITLAYGALHDWVLKCILDRVVPLRFDWEFVVDHLTMIHAGPESPLHAGERVNFGSENKEQ